MTTKLYRSQTDKMVGGVCGGLGHYLGIDTTLVRLFFVILGFANGGIALLLYFVLWIVMPLEGQTPSASMEESLRTGTAEMAQRARTIGDDLRATWHERPRDVGLILGGALIILGGVLFLQNLDLPWLRWFSVDLLWPALLIIGGLALLFRQARGQ
jgi:phage shock protein C